MKIEIAPLAGVAILAAQVALGQTLPQIAFVRGNPPHFDFCQLLTCFDFTEQFDDISAERISLAELDSSKNRVPDPYNGLVWAGLSVVPTTGVLGSVRATSNYNTVGFRGNSSALILGLQSSPQRNPFDFNGGYFGCFQDYVSGTAEPINCTLTVVGSEAKQAFFPFKAKVDDGQPAYDLRGFGNGEAPQHWMSNVTNVKINVTSVDPGVDLSKLGVLLDSVEYTL